MGGAQAQQGTVARRRRCRRRLASAVLLLWPHWPDAVPRMLARAPSVPQARAEPLTHSFQKGRRRCFEVPPGPDLACRRPAPPATNSQWATLPCASPHGPIITICECAQGVQHAGIRQAAGRGLPAANARPQRRRCRRPGTGALSLSRALPGRHAPPPYTCLPRFSTALGPAEPERLKIASVVAKPVGPHGQGTPIFSAVGCLGHQSSCRGHARAPRLKKSVDGRGIAAAGQPR